MPILKIRGFLLRVETAKECLPWVVEWTSSLSHSQNSSNCSTSVAYQLWLDSLIGSTASDWTVILNESWTMVTRGTVESSKHYVIEAIDWRRTERSAYLFRCTSRCTRRRTFRLARTHSRTQIAHEQSTSPLKGTAMNLLVRCFLCRPLTNSSCGGLIRWDSPRTHLDWKTVAYPAKKGLVWIYLKRSWVGFKLDRMCPPEI